MVISMYDKSIDGVKQIFKDIEGKFYFSYNYFYRGDCSAAIFDVTPIHVDGEWKLKCITNDLTIVIDFNDPDLVNQVYYSTYKILK